MRRSLCAVLLLCAACDREPPAPPDPPAESPRPSTAGTVPARWQFAPTADVTVTPGDSIVVETGPHVVLWPAPDTLRPPYTVRADLQKVHGRIHEGYGIVTGGVALTGPESEQRYSYFLIRGDGSYLIKRRVGPELRIVRPWTFHSAIRHDVEGGGVPNEVAVAVGADEVVLSVNGTEVTRVPAGEVDVEGIAGVRVAHDVQLVLRSFEVRRGGAADAATP